MKATLEFLIEFIVVVFMHIFILRDRFQTIKLENAKSRIPKILKVRDFVIPLTAFLFNNMIVTVEAIKTFKTNLQQSILVCSERCLSYSVKW